MPWLRSLVAVVEPLGTLWVNALRMTIIPLVAAHLIVAVNSGGGGRTMGRIGAASFAIFLSMLLTAGAFAVAAAPTLLGLFPIDPGTVDAVAQTVPLPPDPASLQVGPVVGVAAWLSTLLPSNLFGAAANDDFLRRRSQLSR